MVSIKQVQIGLIFIKMIYKGGVTINLRLTLVYFIKKTQLF